MRRWAAVLGLATVAAVVPSCQPGQFGGLGGALCPYFAQGDLANARISADARANVKIRSFLLAARDLNGLSMQMEGEAATACRNMGHDLGLADPQMAPTNSAPGASAQAACNAVSMQIDGILRQGIQVRVYATPPQCQANLNAKASCDASCNVEVDPGAIVAQCQPARLSGSCQGRCTGQCDGTCQGQCQGACTARDAAGNCVGQCQGTCSGTCAGTCHFRCEGQWQAPRCEGYVQPPSADAECNASCSAHANFNASCTPAQVQVQGLQNVDIALRLAATLRANLPLLLHAEIALGRRLAGDVRTVVDLGAQLPHIVGDAGAEGFACITAASSASVQASARINVSLQASANVSGRVGAG
jgi:hypothetical protein